MEHTDLMVDLEKLGGIQQMDLLSFDLDMSRLGYDLLFYKQLHNHKHQGMDQHNDCLYMILFWKKSIKFKNISKRMFEKCISDDGFWIYFLL